MSGRSQMQKCKIYIMVMRAKRRFVVSIPHSIDQHTDVVSLANYGYSGINNGTKVNHFLQAKQAHSWRQQSMCLGPTKKVWQRFWHDGVLSWSYGQKSRAVMSNLSEFLWLEVRWWSLKWRPSWKDRVKYPRAICISILEDSRCSQENCKKSKIWSRWWSRLVQKQKPLLLKLLRRVM